MKIIYGDRTDVMFYEYVKYTPNATEPVDKSVYQNKVERFMGRLNELETEFGFSIAPDYSYDHDSTEAHLLLYDDKYGCIGEIYDEDDELEDVDE